MHFLYSLYLLTNFFLCKTANSIKVFDQFIVTKLLFKFTVPIFTTKITFKKYHIPRHDLYVPFHCESGGYFLILMSLNIPLRQLLVDTIHQWDVLCLNPIKTGVKIGQHVHKHKKMCHK